MSAKKKKKGEKNNEVKKEIVYKESEKETVADLELSQRGLEIFLKNLS